MTPLDAAIATATVATAALAALLAYGMRTGTTNDRKRNAAVDNHNRRASMWNPRTGAITHEARDEEAA